MAKRKVRRRSTWVRQKFLIRTLRTRIVKGHFPPESRLPTRDDLERQFKASRITIQRAFDVLIKEGFVQSRGRLGTFVSVTPPHLYHYALVYPLDQPMAGHRMGLHRSMEKWVTYINQEGPQRIKLFRGIHEPADAEAFKTLREDVIQNRIAGVIFVGEPGSYAGSTILDQRNFPRIAIQEGPLKADMPRIELDRRSFYNSEIAFLMSKKRKRVALIGSSSQWTLEMGSLNAALERSSQVTERCWLNNLTSPQDFQVENLVSLMMRAGSEKAPDSLILTEESFMLPTLRGLKDAGVKESDLDVVVQCFYPRRNVQKAPFILLGYDTREIFDTCFDRIGAQRFKRRIPSVTKLRAVFGQEKDKKNALSVTG